MLKLFFQFFLFFLQMPCSPCWGDWLAVKKKEKGLGFVDPPLFGIQEGGAPQEGAPAPGQSVPRLLKPALRSCHAPPGHGVPPT
jgi:hypothetical protein